MIRCQITGNPWGTDTVGPEGCSCPTCTLKQWAWDRGYHDTFEALEKWKSGHKSYSVDIHIDNSYGATCWDVRLVSGTEDVVIANEVAFFLPEPGTVPPKNLTFVIPLGEDMDGWPGLEATILAALKRAEENGVGIDNKRIETQ